MKQLVHFHISRSICLFTHFTGSHHHTSTDSVERVRGNTGTSGNSPAEQEGSQEVTLERADEEDGLDRVVHPEVQTTVDNDTCNGRTEATVETTNTVRGESLLVDVNQTVELTLSASLGVLGIVRKTRTGVIERVDEKEGRSSSSLDGVNCLQFVYRYLNSHHRKPNCPSSTWRIHRAPS